ncbi:LysR substrate-binding domain-containing protein [Limnobacter humi]|uniref:LysR substrate-binding domain-containing protein n=1 Tax=Limnobacter humi TaxID=1778671 RepID=A0ABT1WCB0_9BURK|nr:LysR substrate-binding domain-containing protein [Limnobacter humi]MCQ8895153.1 LysR substrate-binding domain-containing protein [Limnobacter humi]
MTLPLDSLALIELIETRGSFAAAAMALNKAPSAITYQLRQLEEQLDVLIYDRSGHKAKLTPAGRALLDEGRKLLQLSESVEKRVKAVACGWEAELRIVLDSIVPFEDTIPWIEAFDQLNSPTRLRISTEVLSGSWEALYSGRADLLIGSRLDQGQFATTTGLNIQNIGHSTFVFAVAPHHPLARAEGPLCSEEIAQHRAVAVGDTSRTFKPMTFGLQTGQAVLTVPTLRAKVQAHLAGLGCGWLPWNLIADHVAAGKLLIKPTEDPIRQGTLCCAWHRGNTGNALTWWAEHLARVKLDYSPPPQLLGPA